MSSNDESVPADRRASARERLRRRSIERAHEEQDAQAPEGGGLGDQLAKRPWLVVPLIGAAFVAPGAVSRLARGDDDQSALPWERDVGLHDVVANHPRLCLGVLVLGGAALLGTVAAFLAGWL